MLTKIKLNSNTLSHIVFKHIPLNSSHTVAYNPNARRAYEKSQQTEDFGRIKIICFRSHTLAPAGRIKISKFISTVVIRPRHAKHPLQARIERSTRVSHTLGTR